MRIRSTKPEFWKSRRIAAVDWDARLVLKGLESYVDDNGVGKDDIEGVVGSLFSRDAIRDSSRTVARVSEAISVLHEAGLLWRYEADGDDLLYVSFWEQIQRIDKPQPGRFRRPDGTLNYKDSEIGSSLANGSEPSRTFAPGTGEQRNRGTGEQTGDSADAPSLASDETKPKRTTKRATQRPADFRPSDAHIAMANELGVNLRSEWQAFCDYHDSKGSTFKDWDAALRTWIRNAKKFSGGRSGSRGDIDWDEAFERARQLDEQAGAGA